jgi:ABC-type transport system involved in multi-copper enzyme maturation permease subunit
MIRIPGYLTLIRAHVLQAIHTWWLWVMFAVCILSSLAAVMYSHHGYLDNVDRYSVELQERLRLRLQSTLGPGSRQRDRSLRVLRAPNPAAVLVAGVERTMPSGWDFGPAGAESLTPYSPEDPLAVFDVLTDGESVIRVFGGLLGLALGFGMVSRDQQRGWLRAPTSLPVPAWLLVGAVIVAGSAVLAVMALVWLGSVVTLATWLAGPGLDLGVAWWPTWFFVWAYLVTMFGIGAAMARVAPNLLTGAAAAVTTWTVLILLGPQLLAAVGRLTSDFPPLARVEQERREKYADRQRTADRTLAERLVSAAPDVESTRELDRVATAAFPRFEPDWRSDMSDARAEADAMAASWLETRRRWLGRLRLFARLTPGTLLYFSLAEANGQGWTAQRAWEDAVAKHEAALNRALYDDRSSVTLGLYWRDQGISWAYRWHSVRTHAELPQFDDTELQRGAGRGASAADIAAAIIQAVLVLAFAIGYPVRSEI